MCEAGGSSVGGRVEGEKRSFPPSNCPGKIDAKKIEKKC